MPCCSNCGCEETHFSESTGETMCTQCGSVVASGILVESVSFGESGSGQKHVLGTVVNSERGLGAHSGSSVSREVCLQRGHQAITSIADLLKLPGNVVESAYRIYSMALQMRFTHGRRVQFVAAACLYATCRKEKLPYMLIDFCDALAAPVRILCRVFVKLLRTLRCTVPIIDPSIFLDRFAHQLDLGEKTNKISQAAVRIVQSMDRNWLATGRRPTGLCAASLLIAARFYDVKLGAEDVVSIFRISAPTVNKRIAEFRRTSAAKVLVSDFENVDLLSLEGNKEPPALVERRRREEKLRLMGDAPKKPSLMSTSMSLDSEELEEERLQLEEAPENNAIEIEDGDQDALKSGITPEDLTRIKLPPVHDVEETVSVPEVERLVDQVKVELGDDLQSTMTGDSSRFLSSFNQDDSMASQIADDPLFSLSTESSIKKVPKIRRKRPRHEDTAGSDLETADPIYTDDEEIKCGFLTEYEKQIKQRLWDNMTKDIMGEVRIRERENKRKWKHMKQKPAKPQLKAPPEVGSLTESVQVSLEMAGSSLDVFHGMVADNEDLMSLFAV